MLRRVRLRISNAKLITTKSILLACLIYLIISGGHHWCDWSNLPNNSNVENIVTVTKPILKNMSGPLVVKDVFEFNNQEKVYNLDIFGPLTENTNVIVVQVHTRIHYIRLLLEALSKARGINDSLLIFSHDVFLPSVNSLIQDIKFARVMQIFYPYSSQLKSGGTIRMESGHNSSTSSTVYQKNPNKAEMKLHWWWKIYFVFDELKLLKNYNGVVSFTDEDVYYTENALWMLNLLKTEMIENRCGGCQILTLEACYACGVPTGPDEHFSNAFISHQFSSTHLAFNRTLWHLLKRCTTMYCNYDDNNWDWTLYYLSRSRSPSCMDRQLILFRLQWPRSFHSGDCGEHGTNKNCDPKGAFGRSMESSKQYGSLFPEKLGKFYNNLIPLRYVQPFGGMDEQQLCLSMIKN